jgi:hypothetical protein
LNPRSRLQAQAGSIIFNKIEPGTPGSNPMNMVTSKTTQLLNVARASLVERKDEETAREITVLALKSEDAVDALNKLLPQVPEPAAEISEEEEPDLSDNQVAQIRSVVNELMLRKKNRIAASILGRLDRIDAAKKRRKEKK